MASIDYETEYNNRARVPEHPTIITDWANAARAYRTAETAAGRAVLGERYGDTPRQVVDLFGIPEGRAPLIVFFHGGYWQALDPSFFSHLAHGANARGLGVAIAGYDLCPDVRIGDIITQARNACLHLWRRFGRRLIVTGHSAGGHLTACLLATEWAQLGAGVPDDLAPAGLALSGLFDLAPLTATTVNDKVRMTTAEAHAASPLFWPASPGRIADAWVGGNESAEYLRQSRALADTWGARGVHTRYVEVPGANHFTVIAPFADPASALVARLAELAAHGAA